MANLKQLFAKTKSGHSFEVRLNPIKINTPSKKLGTQGGWDKRGQILINGEWLNCSVTKKDNQFCVEISKYNKELMSAFVKLLNVPANLQKQGFFINMDNWHDLYNEMLIEAEQSFKEIANAETFSSMTFSYHTSHRFMSFRTDNEVLNEYIAYNDRVNDLKNALSQIKSSEVEQFVTNTDYDDYSITYSYQIQANQIDEIISLSAPYLEKAKIRQEKMEAQKRQADEQQENIKNGAIYFNCESEPHNEDLSKVILNRPAPNGGTFTINHRISPELFARIKNFGSYWSKDWLEECDMFMSEPGWRFSVDAVKELSKTNHVYVNNQKIEE